MTDGRYYQREVENIISELKTMDNYHTIRFCDAHTFGNMEQSKQLFTRIIEEGLDFHDFIADIRVDAVIKHPDVMELAYKAGLRVVICGLEATSDEELEMYNKQSSIETTKKALKVLNSLGYNVSGNYIIHPDYTEEDFARVGKFVMENPIFHSGFTILTPFPGTEQWTELKDQIIINDYDYYNLTNAVVKTRLPEMKFYDFVSQLYGISADSSESFYKIYHDSKDRYLGSI